MVPKAESEAKPIALDAGALWLSFGSFCCVEDAEESLTHLT